MLMALVPPPQYRLLLAAHAAVDSVPITAEAAAAAINRVASLLQRERFEALMDRDGLAPLRQVVFRK